jgi:hypothetical protein
MCCDKTYIQLLRMPRYRFFKNISILILMGLDNELIQQTLYLTNYLTLPILFLLIIIDLNNLHYQFEQFQNR